MGKWHHWWLGWLATSAAIAWLSNDFLTATFGTGSVLHIIAVAGGTIFLGVSILFCHDRFQTVNPIQRRFPVLARGFRFLFFF